MTNGWQALRRGESALERRRFLERAHERFIGERATRLDGGFDGDRGTERAAESAGLRAVVLDSWMRARRLTVDPDRLPERHAIDEAQLAELQRTHPIGEALAVVRRLLLAEASESGFIVALGDAAGRLLWVDGDARLRARAEEMGFRAGMDWSEHAVGTSAPGSALALDHAIQVLGAEHYSRAVHPWSCTAAPVHDPASGAIIGVIDVTGGDGAASPHLMPLMDATVAAVEAELQLAALRRRMEQERGTRARPSRPATAPPRLVVLGRDPAMLERDGGALPVSGRHAEILLALAAAPNGLPAAELAHRVYGYAGAEGTLRPEMVRLRRWLEQHATGIALHSRPYRLEPPLRVDAHETLEALSRGAHRLALAAYEGPVLPASDAPVVTELRAAVDATLREAMLQSAAAEPLFDYAQNWAADDAGVWETLLQVLPPLSPKRARVVARLEGIAREQ
ncbi:transcriptional regulator [Leucobacter allii]|uniref:transcriptional regulator n=1 Tax=Leucobacter allii TaxID=2932247 RepID=UPI001FD10F1D|nr:transcriptional regulator [Leucobacter allii]UOR02897.1 transcriptional regulator [Leucobacter allii]